MIKWIPYDEGSPPKENYEFIVCAKDGHYKIAELELWYDGKYRWSEVQEHLIVENVLYYGEINSPFEF